MAKTISNQYILQKSSKEKWHFFHLPNTGICYKKKTDNQWNDYEILLKEGHGDFDVTIDAKDNIHLICQDKVGNIIYLVYNGQQWHKYSILQSKINRPYLKHFKILYVNKWINLFYIIDYKGKSLLVHHILDNSNVPPTVVDYVVKNERPFAISVDNSNNIHIYYQSEIDSGKIGYRMYLWSKKTWGGFTSIEQQDKNISLPYTLIDQDDNIHLIYLKKNDRFYDIVYTRKPFSSFDKLSWDKETTIYSRCYADIPPVLFKTDNKLWILWQQDVKVYSSSSDDAGITWTKASQLIAGRYGNISVFGCRLPPSYNKESIICDLCYGYNTNSDITLYLLSNHLERIPGRKKELAYKIPGYEVEEFAEKNKKSFVSSSDKTDYGRPPFTPRETEAFYQSPDSISDDAFLRSAENISDPAAFFRSASNSAPMQQAADGDNVENTKIKIMLNMLQEELSQTKKKLLELNQVSKIDDGLKKELDEKYDAEIKTLKENFKELLIKITKMEETQNNLLANKVESINKELTILKRKVHKQSFDDLIQKVSNGTNDKTADIR